MNNSEQIIQKIEELLNELRKNLNITKVESEIKKVVKQDNIHGFSGLTKEIFNLTQEGDFFSKPKNISEVAKKLQRIGIIKPTTALSGTLLELVRKKILDRDKPEGERGSYKYFIKK